MKKIFNSFFLFFTGLIIGLIIYRNNYFPINIYRNIIYPIEGKEAKIEHFPYDVFYTKYKKGTPLFSNRSYYDTIGNKELENSYVIQLKRHYRKPIEINFENEFTIYRFLSIDNKHNWIFSDWEDAGFNVYVKGITCTHTKVIKKTFKGGTVKLDQREDIAASPIIIKSKNYESLRKLTINGFVIKHGLKNNQLK